MPASRPILFRSELVEAILRGEKTVTRRLVKPQPPHGANVAPDGRFCLGDHARAADCEWQPMRCPYGAPGDALWCREAYWYRDAEPLAMVGETLRFHPGSVAGGWIVPQGMRTSRVTDDQMRAAGWRRRPSIHMAKWMSRLALRITTVRVERLQQITEADARSEGVRCPCDDNCPAAREAFAKLWDAINGESAPWASSPWVWVVSFERLDVAAPGVP